VGTPNATRWADLLEPTPQTVSGLAARAPHRNQPKVYKPFTEKLRDRPEARSPVEAAPRQHPDRAAPRS